MVIKRGELSLKQTYTLSAKTLLIIGIIFNLCLLGIFKYTDFFLENFNLFTKLLALDFTIPLPHILLPLALSFVTFQQIAFLVDCYRQATDRAESNNPTQEIPDVNFLDYCLFITFFPQLIAGPIVHHREMMPQFHAMNRRDSVSGEPLSLRGDAIAEAIHTKTQKLDSSMDSKETSANAERCPLFCHADKSARNDTNLSKSAKDSRICNEKSGLSSDWQGSYLSGNDRRQSCRIADLSRKAESTKKAESLHIINWEYIAKGLFIFSIGLFKKVVIADSFAKWANAGFSAVESGSVLNLLESWATSLSYTFQLYFDFSGYCDMAIGLGLLFGIVLPLNFSSPYKSRNIAEFWRKWHITLGRFLKEYLYIPLGGNQNIKRVVSKNGEPAIQKKESWFNNLLTLRNLFIVAFLSGVWHGAGWGFVLWGSLHGLAMVGHRAYMFMLDWAQQSSQRAKIFVQTLLESKLYIVLCWFLTFNFVNIAWVFFRAENLQGALNLLKGMFFGSLVLPKSLESRLGEVVNLSFGLWLEGIKGDFTIVVWILGAFALCLVCRNSVEMTDSLAKRVNAKMLLAGCLFAYALIVIAGSSYTPKFLYFNF
nr:MBOAT family O-acyltransferase [uncultured Helicobacter sp.]